MLRACRSRIASPSTNLRAAVAPSRTSARHALPAFAQRRMASTAADLAPKSRWSMVFTGLLFVGVGLTAYGMCVITFYFHYLCINNMSIRYDIYTLMSMWPEEIKEDLRAGVKAKLSGDFVLSAQYLQRSAFFLLYSCLSTESNALEHGKLSRLYHQIPSNLTLT